MFEEQRGDGSQRGRNRAQRGRWGKITSVMESSEMGATGGLKPESHMT